MKKKLMTTVAASALALCAVFAGSEAAHARHQYLVFDIPATALGNKESTWERLTGVDCTKIEFRKGVKSYYLTDYYEVVVVKAGRTNTVYTPFVGDNSVSALSGKDIGHIIFCPTEPPEYSL